MFRVNQLALMVVAMSISLSRLQRYPTIVYDYSTGNLTKYKIYNSTRCKSSEASKEINLTCPDFNDHYLKQNREINQRSISPYRYIMNRDERREPKEYCETECLCTYCIDPQSKKPASAIYRSHPIETFQWVRYKNGSGYGDWNLTTINYGCRCERIQ